MDTTIGNNRPPIITPDQLRRDFKHVEEAVSELEQRSAAAPPVLEDDEDLNLITAIVPDLSKFAKHCDEIRDGEKRPHLEAGRTIDAFFKALIERLTKSKSELERRGTVYLNKKAAAERAKREAEEQAARAEAERRQHESGKAARAGDMQTAAIKSASAAEYESRAAIAADAAAARPSELALTHVEAGTAGLQQEWEFEIENIDRIDMNLLRPYLATTHIEQGIRKFIRAGRRQLPGVRIFPTTKARFRA